MTTRLSRRASSTLPLSRRYTTQDLRIFSAEEARRFLPGGVANPQVDEAVAWELLYRLEPELYDRLARAERLHPDVLEWFPSRVDRIVEVGAGTGRLTLELLGRCDQLIAIEPADPLRGILRRKLPAEPSPVELLSGFFDALPVADQSAEVVVACSVLTPEPMHGGDDGLKEMERVCIRHGMVVIVWPNHVDWLAERGYRYESFPGEMTVDFASLDEAIELASVFFPQAVEEIERRGARSVPYDVLGTNPPRDLCFKVIG